MSSTIEKLKRYANDLEELNKIEGFGTARSEWEDARSHHRCNFEIYTLPSLIAALEWVDKSIDDLKLIAEDERESYKAANRLGELMPINLARNYLKELLTKLEGK